MAKGPKPFFFAVAPKAPHVAATPAPWYVTGTYIDRLSAPRDPAFNASKELLAQHHWPVQHPRGGHRKQQILVIRIGGIVTTVTSFYLAV